MKKTKYLYKTLMMAAVTAASIFMLFSACGNNPVGPTQNPYTISYSINGGSGSTPSLQMVNARGSVTLRSGSGITRSGFIFGGWNTNSDGTGTNYNAGASFTPSSNITLFAKWDPVYTVTYNINGGSGTTPSSQTVNAGNSVSLASGSGLTRSGFTFGGWNTNSSGTGTNYNASSSFTPSSNITLYARWITVSNDGGTLSYGGQNYRTVIIGGKRWMAENLNYSGSGGNVGVCYNGNTSNCNTYGRLYTWTEAMNISSSYNSSTYGSGNNVQHQGICPSGWRLPNDNDWNNLVSAVGSNAGTKLKSQTGWNTGSGYIPGTDEFGFSALPGGYRGTGGSFGSVGSYSGWWSATELDASNARHRDMVWGYSIAFSDWLGKSYGFSVRCLQD